MKNLRLSSFIAILIMLFVSCKKEKISVVKDIGFQARLTFIKGKVYIDDILAKRFSKINEDSVVRTAKNSIAIIQFGDGALITLKSKTSIKMERLNKNKKGKREVFIRQSKGYSFSKIKKGQVNYHIRSTTSVAAVRGTSFSFSVGKKGKTRIKLLKGKIKASPIIKGKIKEKKSVMIKPGQKLSSSKKGLTKVKKLRKKDKKNLKKLNSITFVKMKVVVKAKEKIDKLASIAKENQNKKPESNKQVKTIEVQKNIEIEQKKLEQELAILAPEKIIAFKAQKVLIKHLKKKSKKSKKKKIKKKTNLSIAQLKKKYGKYGDISEIFTKNGKKYTGIFLQKKTYMKIYTQKGVVKVKMSNIKKINQL